MSVITIVCEDTQVIPEAVENVLVQVYDVTGATLITSGSTDVDGEVEFTVPDATYRVRFSMSTPGYAIDSPQEVIVSGDGTYDIEVELFEYPVASDVLLCRCSGYFRDPTGRARSGLIIHIDPVVVPALVESGEVTVGISVIAREIITDEDGYAVVDLYRGGNYRFIAAGMENHFLHQVVPDRSSTNLIDVMFPVVQSIAFDPTSLALAPEESDTVEPTFTLRSGVEATLSELTDYGITVTYVSTPEGLVVTENSDDLSIKAPATAGTYVLTVEGSTGWAMFPAATISGQLSVTVS